MRKPILVVTAHFVDAVETRLNQDFELRRKNNGAQFAPDEIADDLPLRWTLPEPRWVA
jgi:hypothetical protein